MILVNVFGIAGDAKHERTISIYLAHRHSGAKLKGLGASVEMKDSAIAQTTRRLKADMAVDSNLKKLLSTLEDKLKMSSVET